MEAVSLKDHILADGTIRRVSHDRERRTCAVLIEDYNGAHLLVTFDEVTSVQDCGAVGRSIISGRESTTAGSTRVELLDDGGDLLLEIVAGRMTTTCAQTDQRPPQRTSTGSAGMLASIDFHILYLLIPMLAMALLAAGTMKTAAQWLLLGAAVVVQFPLWTRVADLVRANHPVGRYIVANELLITLGCSIGWLVAASFR